MPVKFGFELTQKLPPNPDNGTFKFPVRLQLFAKYCVNICDDGTCVIPVKFGLFWT